MASGGDMRLSGDQQGEKGSRGVGWRTRWSRDASHSVEATLGSDSPVFLLCPS